MSAQPARGDEARASRGLRPGGGGGTADGMVARVARLEAHAESLRAESAATRSDVVDIRVGLATLTERVGTLVEASATLSERFDVSNERSTTLTAQVATLTERMAHSPSKGFVVAATGTALALLASLILFGEKLKMLMGL